MARLEPAINGFGARNIAFMVIGRVCETLVPVGVVGPFRIPDWPFLLPICPLYSQIAPKSDPMKTSPPPNE